MSNQATPTRRYIVRGRDGLIAERMVRAISRQAAIAHVAADMLEADLATPDGTAHWDGKCWTRGPADYRGAPYNGDRWRGLLTPCVEAAGDAPAERQK